MKKKFILFLIYFLFAISVNIVHPITVDYVTSLNLEDHYFGLFVALMSLGQVVGALLFGFLSDKFGRKKIIIIGLVGYCFAQYGFGFLNKDPIILLLFRFLAGVFIAAPSTLFVSMCLDYSNENNKAKNLTFYSSFYILGTSLGYEIGGALYDYLKLSIKQVFVFQIIFTLMTATIFLFLIKDLYLANKEKEIISNENGQNIKVKPIVIALLIPLFILTTAQIIINKYLDTYFIHIGYQASLLGHYVLFSGIFSALSNIAIIPLLKKIKNNKLAFCLLVFVFVSSLLTIITFTAKNNFIYFLFTTHLLYLIIKGWITPLEQNEISLYTTQNNKGKITGFRQMALSLGNVVGPLIGSAIYIKKSPLVFIIASIIILIALVLYIIYFLIKNKMASKEN